MQKHLKFWTQTVIFSLFILTISGIPSATEEIPKPRGEIRIVESWRPDITVVRHNVLQCLFEYAIDRNEMVPCLAVSRKWIDDTTMEIKLREGVRFSNGEPFDAHAVKFNFDYQRKHLPGQAIEIYLKNVKEIQVVDHNTLRMMLDQPDALLMNRIWMLLIGAPKYMEQVGWDGFWNQPIGTGP